MRYKNTPPAGKFDLAKESDEQLVQRLNSPNLFFRDVAQRSLNERMNDDIRTKLEGLVLDDKKPFKSRMHGLWSLVSAGRLDPAFHVRLLDTNDSRFRAWGARAAGNMGTVDEVVLRKVRALTERDEAHDVVLQAILATKKVAGLDAIDVLALLLKRCKEDNLLSAIVWQNLRPMDATDHSKFLKHFATPQPRMAYGALSVVNRAIQRVLADPNADLTPVIDTVNTLYQHGPFHSELARAICNAIHTGQLSGSRREAVRVGLAKLFKVAQERSRVRDPDPHIVLLNATLNDTQLFGVRGMLIRSDVDNVSRIDALEVLITVGDQHLGDWIGKILSQPEKNSPDFMRAMLAALGRSDDPDLAGVILAHRAKLNPELQNASVDLLTQRTTWSKALLHEIAAKNIPTTALNINQVRKLLARKDPELTKQVHAIWGTLREERSPEREKLVGEMRDHLHKTRGDPAAGAAVYKNVCAQCHKLHGEGQDVGPDITANGRSDFEQLLSNVFDPNLVIGAGYQAVTVATKKGQIVSGLVVEDNGERVVLKSQGGQLETIPRADVDEMSGGKVSLMPEGMEKQLKPQEIADLFAYLTLERPMGNPIPGTPPALHGRK